MAKRVQLKAKRQIVGRSMEGEDLSVDAGKTFYTDERTAKDLLNAGYAEAVEGSKRRSTATAEE